MDPGADRLDASPPFGGLAEEVPGDIGELVDLAVATGEEVRQDFAREILDPVLDRVGSLLVGLAAVLDDGVIPEGNPPLGGNQAGATVAKGVDVMLDRHLGLDMELAGALQLRIPFGPGPEDQDHRRGGRHIESDLVPDSDQHAGLVVHVRSDSKRQADSIGNILRA